MSDIAVDANLSVAAQAVVTAGACDTDANLSVAAQAVVTAGACDVDANLSSAAQAVVTAGACDVDANLSSAAQGIITNGLVHADVDDTAVNGETDVPVSSNWAFDHAALTTGVHGAGANTILYSDHTADPDAHGDPVITCDTNSATADDLAFSIVGGEGIDTSGATKVVTIACEDASTSNKGVSELATAAETTTGTDTGRTVTPDGLAGSGYGKRTMSVLVNDSTALTSGDGKAYFPRIPSYLNGWNIIEVAANMVAGTGAVTIQLYNLTQTADILSTTLTIDANEKDSKDAATPAVIDTSEDDLQTVDRIRIDIDGAGTGTTWLDVQITAQLP